MKILFLDHPQFTSASYFLWHGLNELLPPGSVVVYPHMPTHYDADSVVFADLEWYPTFAAVAERGPLPYGIPAFAPGETLFGGDQDATLRYGAGRKIPSPATLPTEASVTRALDAGEFDLVVLANSHRVPTIALGRLKERARALPPVVYYDAGERDELNEHWIHVFRPALVLKQILTPAVLAAGLRAPIPGYTLRLLPLPLSSTIVGRDDEDIGGIPYLRLRAEGGPAFKIYDLFYYMGPTWEGRPLVVATLERLVRDQRLRADGQKSRFEYYHVKLAQSRMAVTTRGSGRDTLRYWEIPLYETLMIADGTMGAIHPFPFTDGRNAVFYRSLDELVAKILRYRDPQGDAEDERRSIAREGRIHLWRYHSNAARAVLFLDHVRRHVGVSDAASEAAAGRFRATRGWADYTEGAIEGIG